MAVKQGGVHPLTSHPDGMLTILPILARLCGGDVMIADGSGRCVHRVDRDGAVFPAHKGHAIVLILKCWRFGGFGGKIV